jgi:hypothetical protein
MTDEKLQAYFKFDDTDLETNRSGKFSEKQKTRLAALDTGQRNSSKFMGILLIALAVFVVVALPFSYQNSAFLSAALPIGLICAVAGWLILRTTSDKNKNYRLRKMQGPVKYSRHIPTGGTHGAHYHTRIIHLGKSWFYVAEDMPTILQEDAEYRVYTYASQGWTHILSAELNSEAGNNASLDDKNHL